MINGLYTVEETAKFIIEGKKVIVAGHENVLRKLPSGNWIGGTIPYFMSNGRVFSRDMIYVNELPESIKSSTVCLYSEKNIDEIYKDAPENGFSIAIFPTGSEVLLKFALEAPGYESFAKSPVLGWVSGFDLDGEESGMSLAVAGKEDEFYSERAIVMHLTLPDNLYGDLDIINIFEQGEGDSIKFTRSGFQAREVFINGRETNFAEYLTKNSFDDSLPLVADYFGTDINVSIQKIDSHNGQVNFFAPVFENIEYKIARKKDNYIENLNEKFCNDEMTFALSFNCILNYNHSIFDDIISDKINGPMTFGEIAYQLLNQTLVYISIREKCQGPNCCQ